MPSAEEPTYLIEVMPDASGQDFLSRDVDLLVSRIKENLRLSGLKAKPSVSHRNRPSPYRIPSRSWAEPGACDKSMPSGHPSSEQQKKRDAASRHEDDDPYKVLQRLLREGALINEAVKRLQNSDEDLDPEDELDDERAYVCKRRYRRKNFYDEDEPLPPVFQTLDL